MARQFGISNHQARRRICAVVARYINGLDARTNDRNHLAQTPFTGAEKIAGQLLATHRLTHDEKVDTLSSPLLRWFDYPPDLW